MINEGCQLIPIWGISTGGIRHYRADDQYIIAIGTWIDESPKPVDQIIDEFDLLHEKTIVKKT